MIKVELRNISKSYTPGKPVLEPLDLDILPGELFFLLGPSGCGKSTLLRIIAGFVKPDSGEIFFDKHNITAIPPEKRDTAMVFQNYALWPHLTVFENVAFGLDARKIAGAKRHDTVMSALQLVCMEEYAERRPASLSGGQQQRVALARAIAVKPRVLLLDEPLSNLDAKLRDAMRLEIRRICKAAELTAVYVTHDRKEALSMADRMAIIHQGRLQQIGTPLEIYWKPCNKFVAGFLGQSNFFQGTVISSESSHCTLSTPFGELRATAPAFSIKAGQTITGMFRPECVRFVTETANAMNLFPGKITSGSFLGESNIWEIDANGNIIVCCEHCPPPRAIGTEYRFEINQEHVILIPENEINATEIVTK